MTAGLEALTIRYHGDRRNFDMDRLRRCNTRRTYRKLRVVWMESPRSARQITTLSICDAITGGAA